MISGRLKDATRQALGVLHVEVAHGDKPLRVLSAAGELCIYTNQHHSVEVLGQPS